MASRVEQCKTHFGDQWKRMSKTEKMKAIQRHIESPGDFSSASSQCGDELVAKLREKIQTLEANKRRQELTIAAKNRECEELRADNEKLQLYVRLTTSQSQASSAVAYGASQGGMGALRS